MIQRPIEYAAVALFVTGCSAPDVAPAPKVVENVSPSTSIAAPFGATRVVAYSYDACIPSDGKWCSDEAMSFALQGAFVERKNVKAVALDDHQTSKVVGWLKRPETYGGAEGKCFFPHHSLGFYDAQDQLVGEVSICLACNHLRASPTLDGVPVHSQVVEDGESYDLFGFSDAGTAEFISLCTEIGLEHCHANNPFEVR